MCDFLKVKFISERERERERESNEKKQKKINVDSTTVASTLYAPKNNTAYNIDIQTRTHT